MALRSFGSNGHMRWICVGCQEEKSVHVSHPELKHLDPHIVALPSCPCGSQTFLKVHFTPEELSAPNMVDKRDGRLTESYHVAHRHMQLSQHLKNIGKGPTEHH